MSEISPNPAQASFSFTLRSAERKSVDIEVLNASGRVLLQRREQLSPETKQRIELDLQSFPAGIYFIRVSNGASSISRKVLLF